MGHWGGGDVLGVGGDKGLTMMCGSFYLYCDYWMSSHLFA